MDKILPADYASAGIEAVDAIRLQSELRKAAAVFAASCGLVPMLGGAEPFSDDDRLAVEAARERRSKLQRCAEYARRAQSASLETQSKAVARLAIELSSLVE
jgi:hypothetical protein